jgi:hypothetical protein
LYHRLLNCNTTSILYDKSLVDFGGKLTQNCYTVVIRNISPIFWVQKKFEVLFNLNVFLSHIIFCRLYKGEALESTAQGNALCINPILKYQALKGRNQYMRDDDYALSGLGVAGCNLSTGRCPVLLIQGLRPCRDDKK